MSNFKIKYSKDVKRKFEIDEVERYLNEQGGFVDKLMVNVVQKQNDFIICEMNNVCLEMGVNVDKERLKKWLEMCDNLDNLDYETIKDIALRNKFESMERNIDKLKSDIEEIIYEFIYLDCNKEINYKNMTGEQVVQEYDKVITRLLDRYNIRLDDYYVRSEDYEWWWKKLFKTIKRY